MPKKSILLVMFIILSMFFLSSCTREERTFDYESDLRYDFVFVINVGGQNEFEGDCSYNFMGGPISEISLVRAYDPDVIVWRVITLDDESKPFNGIVTPYAHDKLWYPPYYRLPSRYRDAYGYRIYVDPTNPEWDEYWDSSPIAGMIRTHSDHRHLIMGAKYRAIAKRVDANGDVIEISSREFDYKR